MLFLLFSLRLTHIFNPLSQHPQTTHCWQHCFCPLQLLFTVTPLVQNCHTHSLNCFLSFIRSGQPSPLQHETLHTPQPPETNTMRSFIGSLGVLAAAVTSASGTLTAYDIAAQLEQLAFQTYAAKPIVQAFTQSNVRQTLIGQGPVVVSQSKKSMQDTRGSQLYRSQTLFWTRWLPPSWPMLPQWSSQQQTPTKPQSSQLPKVFRMYVAVFNSPFVHANDQITVRSGLSRALRCIYCSCSNGRIHRRLHFRQGFGRDHKAWNGDRCESELSNSL